MGHEYDIGAQQAGRTHVFYYIIIIAYQDTAFPSEKIEYYILVSRRQMRIDEGMYFPVFSHKAVLVYTDIGLVELVVTVFFKKPCQYRDIMLPGDPGQYTDAGPVRNRLGQVQHLLL